MERNSSPDHGFTVRKPLSMQSQTPESAKGPRWEELMSQPPREIPEEIVREAWHTAHESFMQSLEDRGEDPFQFGPPLPQQEIMDKKMEI